MDAVPDVAASPPARAFAWRTVAVFAVLLLAAWWLWTTYNPAEPRVPVAALPAPEPAPAGLPEPLVQKMQSAQDEAAPVVMTAGTPVEYDDDEVADVARRALGRVNAQGEALALLQVVSAKKTVDAYKTVAYELVCNTYDTKTNVGVLLSIKALLDVNGKLYISQLRPYHSVPDPMAHLGAASDPAPPADFEDPLELLAKMPLGSAQ